jgi:hypothetical protein
MTTFDIITPYEGISVWVYLLVILGFIFLTILSGTAIGKIETKSGRLSDEISGASVPFLFLTLLSAIMVILSPGIIAGHEDSTQTEYVAASLAELGYENLDVEQDSFVGSLDGQYITGDIFERSVSEFTVVIRSE